MKQVRQEKLAWISLIEHVEETLLRLHDAEAYLLQGKTIDSIVLVMTLRLASLAEPALGLLCARVSAVLASAGSVPARLAGDYVQSARKSYEQCGALNLVRALNNVDATGHRQQIRLAQEGTVSDCGSPATASSKSMPDEDIAGVAAGPSSLRSKIGLESVLRTSLLLASEKDGEGLIKRVLSVLMQVRSQISQCRSPFSLCSLAVDEDDLCMSCDTRSCTRGFAAQGIRYTRRYRGL